MTRKTTGSTTFEPVRTYADMIDDGWLTPVSFYTPEIPLAVSLWPEAVAQYQKLAAGKKALVFCANQQQAANALRHFLEAGIAAASFTADDGHIKRINTLKGFASGAYQVLIGATTLLGLGNDPSVQVVIMAAPTTSRACFETMVAAAMRPQFAEGMTPAEPEYRRATISGSAKPNAIILDFAGNCQHMGIDNFTKRTPKPDTHLTIPGSLEWDQSPEAPAPLDRSPGGAGEIARLRAELQEWKYRAENPAFNGRLDTWQAACGKARGETEALRAQLTLLNPARVDSCKECGSKSLSWFTTNTTGTSGIQNGRLRTEDVTCQFVLGCDDCSETLRVVNADTIAARLNADTQHAKDTAQ